MGPTEDLAADTAANELETLRHAGRQRMRHRSPDLIESYLAERDGGFTLADVDSFIAQRRSAWQPGPAAEHGPHKRLRSLLMASCVLSIIAIAMGSLMAVLVLVLKVIAIAKVSSDIDNASRTFLPSDL